MVRSEIVEALKKILKSKKITYKILAEEMGMSESGVKKLFTAKDISLGRLTQISDVLGLTLGSIFQLIEEQEIKNVKFSQRQERALYHDFTLFRIFWYLVVDEKNFDEVKMLEKLNKDQLDRYLMKLENLDLIKLGQKNRIISIHKGLLRWSGEGPLLKKINKEWSEALLEKALDSANVETLHRLSYLQLTDKSQKELYRRINDLISDFATISQKEKVEQHKKDLLPVSVLIAATKSSFF